MSEANKKSKSLNELMTELDEVVAWFGSSDIDLDEAAIKFARGAKLVEEIKARLAETENKISQIKLDMTNNEGK